MAEFPNCLALFPRRDRKPQAPSELDGVSSGGPGNAYEYLRSSLATIILPCSEPDLVVIPLDILEACRWLPEKKSKVPDVLLDAASKDEYIEPTPSVDYKRIVNLCSDYLEREGADLVKALQIRNLENLSPYQAIMLSLNLSCRLIRYREDETLNKESDKASISDLLEKTIVSLRKPGEKPGYGVCRHQASAVKAIFEALRSMQKGDSDLSTIVPLVVKASSYYPEPLEVNCPLAIGGRGHALTYFFVPYRQGCAILLFDPTNKEGFRTIGRTREGKPIGDWRTEPLIFNLSRDLKERSDENKPGLEKLNAYYKTLFKSRMPIRAKAYYVARYLDLFSPTIPPDTETVELMLDIIAESPMLFRLDSIEKLVPGPSNLSTKLDSAIEVTILATKIIFPNDIISSNDVMQRLIIDVLKRIGLLDLLSREPQGLIRMWDVNGRHENFNPVSNSVHYQVLRRLYYDLPNIIQYGGGSKLPENSVEGIDAFFRNLREKFVCLCGEGAQLMLKDMDDYMLLRSFPMLYAEFEKNKQRT